MMRSRKCLNLIVSKGVVMEKLADIDKFIVKCVILEMTNYEIAQTSNFSSDLVKRRLKGLFKRYKVKSKVGLVREISRQLYRNAVREADILSFSADNPD